MSRSSRRVFLKSVTSTAAAAAISSRVPSLAAQSAPGPVKIWSTGGDRRYVAGEPLAWKPAAEAAPDAIKLDPAATKQDILGFGGAMTDATCYVLSQLTASE